LLGCWLLPLKIDITPVVAPTRRAARTDARRFQIEQDASLKMAKPLANRLSSDRESALSFGYLFFGRYQRKVTRPKAKAFKAKARKATSLDPRFRGDDRA
jgi:hypothetical protein